MAFAVEFVIIASRVFQTTRFSVLSSSPPRHMHWNLGFPWLADFRQRHPTGLHAESLGVAHLARLFFAFWSGILVQLRHKASTTSNESYALSIETLAVVVMTFLLQDYFLGFLLVIVSWQVALPLTLRLAIPWSLGASVFLLYFLDPHYYMGWRWGATGAFLGFQVFSIVTATLAKSESKSREDQSRINAELVSTRELLRESSKLGERIRAKTHVPSSGHPPRFGKIYASSGYQIRYFSTAACGKRLRIVVAVILLQTLFFKFTGAKESVYIFTTVGAEPWGRIGSGVVELIASILILIPRTAVFGAILSLGTICGALFAHLTKLGIKIAAVDDHGELFALALVVFVCSAVALFLHRRQIPIVGPMLFPQPNPEHRSKFA